MHPIRLFAFCGLLLLPSFAVMAQGVVAESKVTTLDISAEAIVKAEPDIATISSGVLTIAKTADASMKENAVKMNAIFAALKTAGIAAKDIQTSGITVNPQYVYQDKKAPQVTGYQASNTVNVVLRDLKNIGPVLDALIAQGANQINGPTFGIDDPETLLNQARKEAVAKAAKRAAVYAEATGLKLGKIRTISENSNVGYPQPMMMARKMSSFAAASPEMMDTPVASGQVSLNVTVNISYELE